MKRDVLRRPPLVGAHCMRPRPGVNRDTGQRHTSAPTSTKIASKHWQFSSFRVPATGIDDSGEKSAPAKAVDRNPEDLNEAHVS